MSKKRIISYAMIASVVTTLMLPTNASYASDNSKENREVSVTDYAIQYESAQEYVRASTEAWEANLQKEYWAEQVTRLNDELLVAQRDIAFNQSYAIVKQAEAEVARKELSRFAIDSARRGQSPLPSTLTTFLNGPENMKEVVDSSAMSSIAEDKFASLYNKSERAKQDAALALEKVTLKEAEISQLKENAMNMQKESANLDSIAKTKLEEAQISWSKTWFNLPESDKYTATEIGTGLLNKAITEGWKDYLQEYNTSETHKEKLSREEIQRVETALKSLSQPYKENGTSSDGWGCTQFAASILHKDAKKTKINKLYENTGQQDSHVTNAKPGDLVFFADPSAGIHQVGISIYGGFVINASASTNDVTVDKITSDALAVVHVGGDTTNNEKAPAKLPNSLDWKCGSITHDTSEEDQAGWITPIEDDKYSLGSKYGEDTDKYGEAGNPGLEFLTKSKEPVRANFSGKILSIKKDKEWGKTVVIEHSDLIKTRYSSLSAVTVKKGQEIESGDIIGATGKTGKFKNKESHSVLVTVFMEDNTLEPESMFFPGKEGRYNNGQIPRSALCEISTGGLLRCDAARAFEVLNSAYKKEFGADISVTDTYRSLEGQIRCRQQKGNLCATPGQSNHGWGLAVDLGAGINKFGTKQHQWMKENATKYGWYHPEWAEPYGSKPEAWHWEYLATK